MYSVKLHVPRLPTASSDVSGTKDFNQELGPMYEKYRSYVKALETLDDPAGCSVTLCNGDAIIQQRIYQPKETT